MTPLHSVGLLDEVDVLLHPLRSELNWPLGEKAPLDFTQPSAASFAADGGGGAGGAGGLLWRVPFALLDAGFYARTGPLAVSAERSAASQAALDAIKAALAEGVAARAVLTQPHLALVGRGFYAERLAAPFARWCVAVLGALGALRGLDADAAVDYVARGARAARATLARVHALDGGSIQALNLGHAWVALFLPHVLAMIDRVKFGLLTPACVAPRRRDARSGG